MTVIEVSDRRMLEHGITQAYISGIKWELFISSLPEGAIIEEHLHPEHQFGYCFDGILSFTAGDQKWKLKSGSYYCIGGQIPHSARVERLAYTLDFKCLVETERNCGILSGIVNSDNVLTSSTAPVLCPLSTNKLAIRYVLTRGSLSTPLYISSMLFVVCAARTHIRTSSGRFTLEPLGIYALSAGTLFYAKADIPQMPLMLFYGDFICPENVANPI